MGVCFDTCHTWDAGYDLVNDLDGVLTRFGRCGSGWENDGLKSGFI